jgi:FtsP/CotA-like multicopper oxidase with cupredoxin domain
MESAGGGARLTRAELLKLGLLGGAGLVVPLTYTATTQARALDRLPPSRIPEPFQVPLAIPPIAQPVRRDARNDYYQLTMQRALVQILPGFPRTEIFGYDGITPGPTIVAVTGRDAVVRHINRLPRTSPFGHLNATSVHLHGMAPEPPFDGWADDLTEPGQYKDYVWPNDQGQRLLWYHDHAVHHTALNTYMGLAGFYSPDLNDPSGPFVSELPRGRYFVPLMLQDKIFSRDGQFVFDDRGERSLFGDVILVNGAPWPVMPVERRKYVLGFLNASNSRGFNLALSSDEPFMFIGQDAGLGLAPVGVESFRIGPGERYGLVLDFAKHRIGDRIVLQNRELKNNEEFPSTRQVMRFDVVSDATSTANNVIPDILVPARRDPDHPHDPMPLQESQAVATRDFRFERDHGLWTVNGVTWEEGRVRAQPGHDDVEVWRFINNSGGWNHPIHVHLVDFKILDRNGQPPFPYEVGRKDTVYLGEGETVRVIAKFGPKQGKYMMHCHNTVHEDHDMMIAFQVGDGGAEPMSVPARNLPAPPL